MNQCVFDELNPPAMVNFLRPICRACGTMHPPTLATYSHDEVVDGILIHVSEPDMRLVCSACGHSTDRLIKPCKSGNSAETAANASEVAIRILTARECVPTLLEAPK